MALIPHGTILVDAADTGPLCNGVAMTAFGSPVFVNEVAGGLQAYKMTAFSGGYRLPVTVSMSASTDRSIYIAVKFRATGTAGSTKRIFGVTSNTTDLADGSSVGLNAAGLICPSLAGSLICSQALEYNGQWVTALYKVEFRSAANQDIGHLWYEPDGSGVDTPNVSSSAVSRADSSAAYITIMAVESVTMHYRCALVMEAETLADELTNAQARALVNDLEGYITGLIGGSADPVVTCSGAALAYTENTGAVALDSGITVTDSDSTDLTGATVQITGAYQSAEDVLAFTNQLGITGSWNSGTGTLTLSGTTTVANYQTALRAVTYRNTSLTPVTTARTVTFTVETPEGTGDDTRGITITAVTPPDITTATLVSIPISSGLSLTPSGYPIIRAL